MYVSFSPAPPSVPHRMMHGAQEKRVLTGQCYYCLLSQCSPKFTHHKTFLLCKSHYHHIEQVSFKMYFGKHSVHRLKLKSLTWPRDHSAWSHTTPGLCFPVFCSCCSLPPLSDQLVFIPQDFTLPWPSQIRSTSSALSS